MSDKQTIIVIRFLYFDSSKNEPGMTLQREYREDRYLVWRDYQVDGKVIQSPVDIDKSPDGRYRLKP
jgi:hypothetical protein